ncbi:MAG TPA: GNAT family N-acetyltransferase [Gaiellales bacterium]|nr:GNAT family N-acetyltransferase [Gaiellales bacterium]
MSLPPAILGLAEDANTHTPLGPGQERIERDEFVLWMMPGLGDAHGVVAQRLRLRPERVERVVAEIRDLVRARGKVELSWEVGSSATPPDLVERLLALGMRLDDDPHLVAVVCSSAPAPAPEVVEVRRVESREEFETGLRIAYTAFGGTIDADVGEQYRAWRGDRSQARYLALVEGRPVGSASATFTPHGAVLNAGATLPDARGLGAYRALVRARWDDAAARGTPALITQAGRMSLPILERLGFREVARITVLVDRL